MEALTGTLEFVKFHRNGFLIGQLDSGDTILGDMLEPCEGQKYRFTGEWVDNPRWGKQFKFARYQAEIPPTTDGIYRYIVRTAKWVGPKVGRDIIKFFGNRTLAILKYAPLRVAISIRGITLERAEEISRGLLENEDLEAAAVELENLFGGVGGLPKKTIPRLIERFGSDAPAQVRRNPYVLQEIRGVGFPTADRTAIKLGVDRESLERRAAATVHVLEEAAYNRGHVWLPLDKYEEKLQALIGVPSDGVITTLIKNKTVVLPEVMRAENGCYKEMLALWDLAMDERDVAGMVRLLLQDSDSILKPDPDNLEGLAEDQQEALRLALAHRVFILTGAPGTGKTFTLQRLIREYEERDFVVKLAAPTGKAAKRMSEVIGREASTIHRLLGPEPVENGGELRFRFTYGIGNPLPADVVVVDELSMVDVSLAASLLRALSPGVRLLIVGDHYQLPSVGPGSVLRDLLASGVPNFELTEIKRNTGDIVQACHAIKDGRPVAPSPKLEPESGLNLRHIEESAPQAIQEIIRDLVATRLPQRGYDPVWDIQVLSPMNEKTLLSCLHLNDLLQKALNPTGEPIPGSNFRRGDKVIQKKNETIGGDDGVFVVNGDLGTMLFLDDKGQRRLPPTHKLWVEFQDPDRLAKIDPKSHNLALAYCLTVHKMQGSEAPVVIIPVHTSFGAFFNRELIYTAISRARDICLTIGQWSALEQAAQRVGNIRRITRLQELLK
jgi:exodeoxyribonuclease V alpha subunit